MQQGSFPFQYIQETQSKSDWVFFIYAIANIASQDVWTSFGRTKYKGKEYPGIEI